MKLKHQPKRLERNIKKIVSVNHYLTISFSISEGNQELFSYQLLVQFPKNLPFQVAWTPDSCCFLPSWFFPLTSTIKGVHSHARNAAGNCRKQELEDFLRFLWQPRSQGLLSASRKYSGCGWSRVYVYKSNPHRGWIIDLILSTHYGGESCAAV